MGGDTWSQNRWRCEAAMTHHFLLRLKTSPQGASRHLWCFRAGSGRRRCGEVGGVQGLVVSKPFLNQSNGIKVTLTSRFRYQWFLLEDRHGLASVAYIMTEQHPGVMWGGQVFIPVWSWTFLHLNRMKMAVAATTSRAGSRIHHSRLSEGVSRGSST